MQLLVFNAGSSSLKFELAAVAADGSVSRLLGGSFVDAADGSGEFVCRDAPGMTPAQARVPTLTAAAHSLRRYSFAKTAMASPCPKNVP